MIYKQLKEEQNKISDPELALVSGRKSRELPQWLSSSLRAMFLCNKPNEAINAPIQATLALMGLFLFYRSYENYLRQDQEKYNLPVVPPIIGGAILVFHSLVHLVFYSWISEYQTEGRVRMELKKKAQTQSAKTSKAKRDNATFKTVLAQQMRCPSCSLRIVGFLNDMKLDASQQSLNLTSAVTEAVLNNKSVNNNTNQCDYCQIA